METNVREFQITSIRVCLDEKEPEYKGRICGVGVEKELAFSNKDELIWAIEKAYAAIGKPQPVLVKRSFSKHSEKFNSFIRTPEKYHSALYIHEQHGKAETHDLIITSMKHAEWQGFWRNTDGSNRCEFKSMLQCMDQI